MLKKQLISLILITEIALISCFYDSSLEASNPVLKASNPVEFILQIVEIILSKTSSIPLKNKGNEEVKPNFKDEKLVYIYDNKRWLKVCRDGQFVLHFSERASKVYQINSHQYIIEFGCGSGAYSVFYEYLLYAITDHGIEIKPLQVMWIDNHKGINLNDQLIWTYSKLVGGRPTFDANSLTLKVSTVRNLAGYEAEYKFEEDEFKLIKYTIFTLKITRDKAGDPTESISEPKVVYP
jgi:hypothetical protein